MEKILLVGDDVNLLASRTAVLALKKIEVVFCAAYALAAHPEGEKFDLIVLCHSLDLGARAATMRTAHQRWPGVRMLQILRSSYEMSPAESGTDAVTVADPKTLIENVMKLLGHSYGSREIPPPPSRRERLPPGRI